MNPKINFDNLVRQLTPIHKRQSVRLDILRVFVGRLKELFDEFDKWRDHTRMMINVNSQVKVLEGYLRVKYNEPISIKIETFFDNLLGVGLEGEGDTFMPPIGLEHEKEFAETSLINEIRVQFGDVDFIVYIPRNIDIELIRAEIERYKRALAKYKIIQN